MMEIEIPEIKNVSVEEITADGNNPNRMIPAKFEALKESIRKFGFLIPVVTNKDLQIADGEHRWRAAKELGMEQVPAVILPVNEVDRAILRQVMNKLKGRHDKMLDLQEYRFISENNGMEDLKCLLAIEDESKLLAGFEPDTVEYDENLPTDNQCPKCGYKW